jgi:citrate lyase beta subunit
MSCNLTIQTSGDGRNNIWCMIETAKGVQNVASIANLLPVTALVFGSNDLTKDLRAKHTPSRSVSTHSPYNHCIYI